MYDKSTNYLKNNSIFDEYFHEKLKGYVKELIVEFNNDKR